MSFVPGMSWFGAAHGRSVTSLFKGVTMVVMHLQIAALHGVLIIYNMYLIGLDFLNHISKCARKTQYTASCELHLSDGKIG